MKHQFRIHGTLKKVLLSLKSQRDATDRTISSLLDEVIAAYPGSLLYDDSNWPGDFLSGGAIVLGDMDWDCKGSPFAMCAYDTIDDRAKDHCIFCGNPHDRK